MNILRKIRLKLLMHLGLKDLSYYRVLKLITSANGWQKIFKLSLISFNFIIRKIFNIKDSDQRNYRKYVKKKFPNASQLASYQTEVETWNYKPLVSILLPVYNVELMYLKKAIESVKKQAYQYWELCIADDNSTKRDIKSYLSELDGYQTKIKVVFRQENGHISACSNSALNIATGEYVALLDHDDELRPDALYHFVKKLQSEKEIDFLYSDEDKIDEKGNHLEPFFKPDFSLDYLLSNNYICHFACIRKSIVTELGGFRIGFEGSQDYDLFLRVIDTTLRIKHVPEVLYHWRMHKGSTAAHTGQKQYAIEASKRAITDYFKRKNIPITLQQTRPDYDAFIPRYTLTSYPKVSIVIPTKNKPDLCDTLLKSIYSLTTYPNFEIILVDNNSNEKSFFEAVALWKDVYKNFVYVRDTGDFNYSRIINLGFKQATGELLLQLNNDMEIIDGDWLTALAEYAIQPGIGCVGAYLLYPNDSVQHAGVVLGLGGMAGHVLARIHKEVEVPFKRLDCVTNFLAVTGACLMVKRSVFFEVNGMNETLKVEFNDIDFCLKVYEAGYRNVWLPHVKLYHYESISRGHPHKTKASYAQHLEDVSYFKEKWQHFIDHDPFYNPNYSRRSDNYGLAVPK